jgi:hypothetical protein
LAPEHRGVTKSLGYCYMWLGEFDQAQGILTQIPEAYTELDVYIWWWHVHGRDDLADKASAMLTRLEAKTSQP